MRRSLIPAVVAVAAALSLAACSSSSSSTATTTTLAKASGAINCTKVSATENKLKVLIAGQTGVPNKAQTAHILDTYTSVFTALAGELAKVAPANASTWLNDTTAVIKKAQAANDSGATFAKVSKIMTQLNTSSYQKISSSLGTVLKTQCPNIGGSSSSSSSSSAAG